jgi:hypothetical protein
VLSVAALARGAARRATRTTRSLIGIHPTIGFGECGLIEIRSPDSFGFSPSTPFQRRSARLRSRPGQWLNVASGTRPSTVRRR